MSKGSAITEVKTVSREVELPLLTDQIQSLIPHRFPFLLVDRVDEFVSMDYIRGVKCVTVNEPFFEGHFPGRPIMPGVLILEALAQLGGIFANLCSEKEPGLVVFAGVDNVKFRKQVVPGDVLELEMKYLSKKLIHWKMQGTAKVNGTAVTQATLLASIVPA